MLNGYEQSTALPEGSKGRLEAEAILHQHHPNAAAVIDGQGGVDYFAGLSGMDQRFVPFNGEQSHIQFSMWSLSAGLYSHRWVWSGAATVV